MKPAPFDYLRAETLEHACDLLAVAPDDSKILAGGQSLIAMMNFRLARPKVVIDVSNIENHNQITAEEGGLRIRATTIQRYAESSVLVQERLPLLCRAIQHIAHVQIRNKGTIGGNIANADPASELPALALALEAEIEIISSQGKRTVPAAEFFITSMVTTLAPCEVLASVRFAEPPAGSGWGFHEVARRAGDYALAGCAAVITLDAAGKCSRARVALFGVAATPVRARATEDALVGREYSPELLQAAGRDIQSEIAPESDVHVTAAYRRSVAETMTVRSLEDAFRRARERR
jgi:aerobic carbon-monoxide dehydrogenase medium subunit